MDPRNLFLKGFKYDKQYKIYKEDSKSQPEKLLLKQWN